MKTAATKENIIALFIVFAGMALMHFGHLPAMVAPAILLLSIWAFQHFMVKSAWNPTLFSFKNFEWKAVWTGAVTAILLSLFFQFLWNPLIDKLMPGEKIDLSAFDNIRGHFFNYVFLLVAALLVGGFFEEIFFHGLLFTTLERMFNNRFALVISVIFSNLVFGLYHFHMGIREILLAFIAGSAYHFLVLKYKRNLWYGILFHTFFDFIGLTQIYLGYS